MARWTSSLRAPTCAGQSAGRVRVSSASRGGRWSIRLSEGWAWERVQLPGVDRPTYGDVCNEFGSALDFGAELELCKRQDVVGLGLALDFPVGPADAIDGGRVGEAVAHELAELFDGEIRDDVIG